MRAPSQALLLVVCFACGPETAPGKPTPCNCPDDDNGLDGDFIFSDDRPDRIRLEAEDFAGGWSPQSNFTDFSGWGFIVSNASGVANDTVWATVDLWPGNYQVWVRAYADETDRAFAISVNGAAFPATHAPRKDEHGFFWERAGEIEIASGLTELRLSDAGAGFEAVDTLLLTPDDRWEPSLEPELRVIDPERVKPMIVSDMVARADRYAARRPMPATREEWLARAEALRPQVLHAIGLDPLPDRTPLEPQLIGTSQRDGYRIERILFESRPNFPVPANLFVPDGEGPFPVVLSPLGHWGDKSHPVEASRAHALAKLGYLVMTYDPFGQGERTITGNQHRWFTFLALTGHHNLSFMVWDTMRALDYVLSRPEADASRVAATGASGGGLNTLFLSVAEPRITASIPVSFPTTFSALIGAGSPHDGCAYLPQLAGFTDMDEIAALFGARPQLFMGGDFDMQFPIEGTIAAHAGAAARYALLDAEDQMQLVHFPVGHEYDQPMRETMYGFLAHVFDGAPADPIPEPTGLDLPASDSEEIQVSSDGHVSRESTKVQDFGRAWATGAIERLRTPDAIDPERLRASLIEVLRVPARSTPRVFDKGESTSAFGFTVRSLSVEVSVGIELPAYFVKAEDPSAPVIVFADDAGLVSIGQLDHLRRAGVSVLYLPVRGTGETHWDEWSMFGDNLLLGDSVLGQRAFDLAQAAAVARVLAPGAPVGLLAQGAITAPAGLAAQALLLPFDAIAVGPLFPTYLQAYDRGIPFSASVFRLLDTADVAHFARLAGERPALVAFDEGAPDPPASLGDWSWVERTRRLDLPEGVRWLISALTDG